MGLGPVVNGKQQPITPRNGTAWCDTVNTTPMSQGRMNTALAIGTCKADGSGFVPYEKPKPRLWRGDFRL